MLEIFAALNCFLEIKVYLGMYIFCLQPKLHATNKIFFNLILFTNLLCAEDTCFDSAQIALQ